MDSLILLNIDGGEGDPVSPAGKFSAAPPDPNDLSYPSPRGLRKMRRAAERAKESEA